MTLKEMQTVARAKRTLEFGRVGIHEDCRACRDRECVVLKDTVCRAEVCQFYKRRGGTLT